MMKGVIAVPNDVIARSLMNKDDIMPTSSGNKSGKR